MDGFWVSALGAHCVGAGSLGAQWVPFEILRTQILETKVVLLED